MSEVTLELSPHELYFLPPSTPATAPATRVEVEGETFLVRVEKYKGVSDREILLFYQRQQLGNIPILAHELSLFASEFSRDEASLRKHICVGEQARWACRCWHPANENYGVMFLLSGTAFLRFDDVRKIRHQTKFQWRTSSEQSELV